MIATATDTTGSITDNMPCTMHAGLTRLQAVIGRDTAQSNRATIDSTADATVGRAIQGRLRAIYRELDTIREVEVVVTSRIVTLSGVVA